MAHWAEQLRESVGLDEAEVLVLRSALMDFCDEHGVTPLEVCARWRDFPELTSGRTSGRGRRPRLAVESFLVHNGVNLFSA